MIIKKAMRNICSVLLVTAMLLTQASAIAQNNTPEQYSSVIIKLYEGASPEKTAAAIDGIKLTHKYSVLLNGFAAEVTDDALKELTAIPSVEAVYSDTEYSALSADETEYKLVYAPGAKPDTDITRGSGAVVAVLDDGFYLRHEAFTLSDNTNIKLLYDDIKNNLHFTKAYHLYPYTSTKKVYKNEKIPFAFDYGDRDTDVSPISSHGTAMLSVAVGNASEQGLISAAPAAQAFAMKVYEDKANTAKTSAIVAALEDAYILGADSICLSLGSPCGFSDTGLYDTLVEETIKQISKCGVTVVCAAGNESSLGAGSIFNKNYGYYEPLASMPDNGTVNAPSTVPEAISVASADTFVARAHAFSLADTDAYIPYSDTNADIKETGEKSFGMHFSSQTLEYVPIAGLGKPEDFLLNGNPLDLTGKLALIKRGELSFVEKINNAAERGAIAAIIYDNQQTETPSIRTAMQLDGAKIPAIFISMADGEMMLKAQRNYIFVDPYLIYITDAGITPSVSEFSSRGPSPTLDIKPELAAAGTDVTIVSAQGLYKTMSGTSVAAAYTAGVAASVSSRLVLNDSKNNAVKTVLMNTAVPMATPDNEYYSVTLQGAGYISPSAARNAKIIVSSKGAGKILLGNNLPDTFEMSFSLENLTNEAQSYSLSAIIGTESFETLSYSELCSEKDSFTKQYGRLMSDYLGVDNNDEVSFVKDQILEFNSASVTYNDVEINKRSDNYADAMITLSPGESRDITLSVRLNSNEIKLLKGVFENGMYIEGFVFLESLSDNDESKYSIPFLGFSGDFYSADPFDSSLYENGGIFGGMYLYTYFADDFEDSTVLLGTSDEVDDNYTHLSLSSELAVLSPVVSNSDCAVYLKFNLLRNLKKLQIDLLDEEGNKVTETQELYGLKKAYLADGASQTKSYSLKLWDCRDKDNSKYIYDDGNYVCRLTGTDASGREFVKELSFVLDAEKPEYISHEIREDDGDKFLDVTVCDNSYVSEIHAYAFNGKEAYSDNNVLNDEKMLDNGIGGKYTVTFDITKSAGQYIYVEIIDLAFNKSIVRIDMGK